MLKMEIKEGTHVFTADGEDVGEINRFILDPATNEVTHIVVQKGWLLPEDKVVPFEMVNSATEDKVILSEEIDDFNELPPFEETHYVSVSNEDLKTAPSRGYRHTPSTYPAYYWYPPYGYLGYPAYGLGLYPTPVETERNIPPDKVPLQEGSDVISSDGKHVGDVERIFVDPDSNQATHFLISQGLVFKDRKLVPIHWVTSVKEDKVHLSVAPRLLERLPSYEEA